MRAAGAPASCRVNPEPTARIELATSRLPFVRSANLSFAGNLWWAEWESNPLPLD
jgi:hypothetical protein